jgi:hypothetical protein
MVSASASEWTIVGSKPVNVQILINITLKHFFETLLPCVSLRKINEENKELKQK